MMRNMVIPTMLKPCKYPRIEFIIDAGGTVFKPAVYKLEINNKNLVFASGEISNGIWGFALPE